MTAIHAAATIVFATAALFFMATQILISWRQIMHKLHANTAIKQDDIDKIKKMLYDIHNKINENTDGNKQ